MFGGRAGINYTTLLSRDSGLGSGFGKCSPEGGILFGMIRWGAFDCSRIISAGTFRIEE